MTDEIRDSWPGIIKKFVSFASAEVVDVINTLINDINVQLASIITQIQALGGSQPLGGDLTGTLPNPTIGSGAVTSTKIASGAAASNVGTLGGVLTGTLPNPGLGTLVVDRANVVKGKSIPQWFDVKAYGAVGDGTTDDTTNINLAIAAANAAGPAATLYFPAGTYVISNTLTTITCANVLGDGQGASVIVPNGNFPTMVVTTYILGTHIEGFTIQYTPVATSGAGYALSVTNSAIKYDQTIRDVGLWYTYSGLNISNWGSGIVDGVRILNFNSVGINVAEPASPDGGDNTIVNCAISGPGSGTSFGIFWVSSGGLRVVNNKFTACSYGVNYSLASGVNTSQLQVHNNSFDTISSAAVAAARQAATGTLGEILVNNNVMQDAHYGVYVPHDANGAWVTNLLANGNSYMSDFVANAAYLIIDGVTGVMAGHAALVSNVASCQALNIASGVTTGVVGPFSKVGTFAANTMNGTGITSISPV